MVAVIELDRLYFHFKSLLFSGFKASLAIEADNGNASVTLTAGLGPVNNCEVVKKKKKQRSPSYLKRLEKRKNARNKLLVADTEDEVTAEKVATSEMEDAAAEVQETETVSDESTVENEAVEATPEVGTEKQEKRDHDEDNEAVEATSSSLNGAAEKQERRFWLCIFHGCIDNTTLEDLQCSCCGDECQVVEYDSEVEYEPD